MAKSDVAFGSEFSPEQVSLPEVLDIVGKHEGNSAALLRAIQRHWYPDPEVAKNLPLALKAYGIIADGSGPEDRSPAAQRRKRYHITPEGKVLTAAKGSPEVLHEKFARHIMLRVKGGMAVVNVIEDLSAAGKDVTMTLVRDELVRRGHHIPKNSMSATRIRQWLQKAGVVTGEPFRVDETRKAAVLGASTQEIETLEALTKEQKAYARALARMCVSEVRANEVEKYAVEHFGVRFPDTGLPQSTLAPLKAAGLLDFEKTTTGRGAKPPIVRPTDRLRSEVLEPLLDAVEKSAGLEYRGFVRKPWDDVMRELRSDNRNVKGKTLEALAAKLAFLLGLEYRHWRLRGAVTGGAEVDLIVESIRQVFLRWNIQCKNTGTVRLDDVAKEVGLAIEMGSNVVMVVSTGKFSADAREHAKHVMARTNLAVVLVDGRDLDEIARNPAAVVDILQRAAALAKTIKRLEIEP